MDLEDLAELGLVFGGFELLEGIATVLSIVIVLAVVAGAILLLSPDLATTLVMFLVAVVSAIAGGLLGMKAERVRRKAFR